MLYYEYQCPKCDHRFEALLTFGKELEQVVAPVFVITSKKS